MKTSRERIFTPRLRVADYDELNAVLRERTLAHAAATAHPEMKDRTILEVFEEERASLVTPQGPFEGFHDGVPLLRHWSERQWRARRCRRPAS